MLPEESNEKLEKESAADQSFVYAQITLLPAHLRIIPFLRSLRSFAVK